MAFLSTSARRFLSTAANHPVPLPHLRRLARAGRHADIDAVVPPLLHAHPAPVLAALSSLGLPDRASALLSSLPSPLPSHLNALLSPLLRRRRLACLVPSLLSAHPSIPRDASTLCILAKSLCLSSGAASVLHLLDQPHPSLPLFTTLIDSSYKEHLPAQAEALWRRMVADEGIRPDAAAHNVRITYRASNGTVEEVNQLIAQMREEGLKPDIITFNALMRILVRYGKVEEAVAVYRGLEEEGCAASCATYKCLVLALCKEGRVVDAEDVFYDGVRNRKVVDLGTVRVLVRALKAKGRGRRARRVVVGLRKKFPDDFVGQWKQLEELIGLPCDKDGGDDGGEDEEEEEPAVPV